LHETLEAEKARVTRNIEFLKRIKEALEREQCDYVVMKSLDNYPDLGRDWDLFILDKKEKVLGILTQQFGGNIARPVLSERLGDKTNIIFNSLPTVRLHHQRLGVLGEEKLFPKILMKNKRLQQVEGVNFPVPCNEDRILIAADHRINRHFCIRLCDIYNTLGFINKKNLDWDYLWKTAEVRQIKPAVEFYLEYIKRVTAMVNSYQVNTVSGALPFKRMFFRFPIISIAPKSFGLKLWGLVKALDGPAALRISLALPLLFVAGVQKMIGKKTCW
jgi:hypothetical protein